MMSKFPVTAKADRFVKQVNAKPTASRGPARQPLKPVVGVKAVDVAALKAACIRFLPV